MRKRIALIVVLFLTVACIAAVTEIDLTTQVKGILPHGNGGTDSAYVSVSGPTAVRIYTLPDSNATFEVQALTTQTSTYSIVVSDKVVLMNCSSACTVTVPTTGATGKTWIVKTIGSGAVTVQGSSGTIDGNSSVGLLVKYQSITVVFDGTNFELL